MRNIVLFMILCTCSLLTAQVSLPSCYHTYPEIDAFLNEMVAQYPDQAKRFTIGYSQEDHVPIYALKISDSVDVDRDVPELLFVGQAHAEEVLGTEIVLNDINQILTHQSQTPYETWLSSTELWFIPTMNPEGFNLVMDGINVFYRKNKRDSNNNHTFDYPYDGVDLNRNFAFNWVHGDTLGTPAASGDFTAYDYYRGEAPFSESESKAIRDFAALHHIVYSINWHSSRTGNTPEDVYYSFDWQNQYPSADIDLAQQIGDGTAANIISNSGSGHYPSSPTLSRRGATNDWFYQAYGTIQLLIECGGGVNIQPDSIQMTSIVQRCSEGTKWIINRALPYSANETRSMLTGRITDIQTGQPLQAEVTIEERKASYLAPRMSDATYGRYWRPLTLGVYTLTVKKKGYMTVTIPGIIVHNTFKTTQDVQLTPLPVASYSGIIKGNSVPILAQIIVYDDPPDTIYTTNGNYAFQTYQGTHKIQITAEGYFPYIDSLQVTEGIHSLNIDLSSSQTVFTENWESGTSNWTITGPWALQTKLSHQGKAMTDSPTTLEDGFGFYAANCDVNIVTIQPIQLPQQNHAYLTFWQNLYTNWDNDFARVEISTNNTDWEVLSMQSGQFDWWHPIYISLDTYAGQSVYLKFRLKALSQDADLTDPGWTIDDIQIISGNVTATNDPISPSPKMYLSQNYPNPFNPETTIRFGLQNINTHDAKIKIYNIRGQQVKGFLLSDQQKREGKITWHAAEQASGIYFYTLEVDGKRIATHKAVLLK